MCAPHHGNIVYGYKAPCEQPALPPEAALPLPLVRATHPHPPKDGHAEAWLAVTALPSRGEEGPDPTPVHRRGRPWPYSPLAVSKSLAIVPFVGNGPLDHTPLRRQGSLHPGQEQVPVCRVLAQCARHARWHHGRLPRPLPVEYRSRLLTHPQHVGRMEEVALVEGALMATLQHRRWQRRLSMFR